MTQSSDPLESRVRNLENGLSDLRFTAEALLQTVIIHQQNFEVMAAELQAIRREQHGSNQRFEVMLAELRQMRIESDARFNATQADIREMQAEIRQILDQSNDQQNGSQES